LGRILLRKSRKLVVQRHHIRYEAPEIVVTIFKGEHMLLTRLGWRKNISQGFIQALRCWLNENEGKAVNLEKILK